MSTLVLDTTTKTIQAVMSGAAATTNPDFVATYADNNGTTFTEIANDGALNDTTPVTLISAPAASTRRVIKQIFIENKDTAVVTVTVSYNNNGTLRTIAKVTLNVGDTWTTDGTFDTYGNLKQTLGTVNLSSGAIGILPVSNGGTGVATITGLVKGNGTSAFTVAASGTDYAPATSGTSILKGNGSGGFSNAASGTDYAPATSGTSILYGNGSGGFSNVTVGTGLTFSAGTLSSSGLSTGKAIAMAMIFGF
jgi:hypothetical protein